MTIQPTSTGAAARPSSSSLADVIDSILDKGLVIDAFVRVSLVGIEILTIDARIVVASVDTYLRFAEAVNRLDLTQTGKQQGLPELMQNMTKDTASGKAKGVVQGVLEAAGDKLRDVGSGYSERSEEPARRRRERE
ncbi:gas vesicle protein GvpJ [Sinosporangium siamense]|uniref:Gas vesicle protein A n=1 Tax=Sinosporangium siamense TaxID=1367973 RepID=A0A919RFC7_9ACTN|nr:gas vesicle protein GvpJ [Sinosporangium siamense]GII92875.1 putative gas vesicle structural protein 1 [Sinosporangium siamense]